MTTTAWPRPLPGSALEKNRKHRSAPAGFRRGGFCESQEEFDKLVKVGIEKDEREWLWRLAFNYERSKINFDNIVDYFIKKKDGYYLAELISAIGECLNIDSIINKIVDKELIEDLKKKKRCY